MTRPLLSILIPTYGYPPGLERIFQALGDDYSDEWELLVFDDSPDNEIQELVSLVASKSKWALRYEHNQPALGPAANWNALLDAAQGEYCLLLHHDEFPLGDNFVNNILHALHQDPSIDVLVLDCVLVSSRNGCNRRHMSTWLQRLVITHFPQYLFRRNVIGPTAALVVRRLMYPRFNARLQWLIDVDLYVRLLKMPVHVWFCPAIKIGSMLGGADSITAGLGPSIPQLAAEERIYLMELRQSSSIWLGPSANEKVSRSILRFGEAVCWKLMRGFGRIRAAFCFGPVPRQVAQQAIKSLRGHERTP